MQGTHKVGIQIDIEQLDKNGNTLYHKGLSVHFSRIVDITALKDAVEVVEKFEKLALEIGMAEEFDKNVQ